MYPKLVLIKTTSCPAKHKPSLNAVDRKNSILLLKYGDTQMYDFLKKRVFVVQK